MRLLALAMTTSLVIASNSQYQCFAECMQNIAEGVVTCTMKHADEAASNRHQDYLMRRARELNTMCLRLGNEYCSQYSAALKEAQSARVTHFDKYLKNCKALNTLKIDIEEAKRRVPQAREQFERFEDALNKSRE